MKVLQSVKDQSSNCATYVIYQVHYAFQYNWLWMKIFIYNIRILQHYFNIKSINIICGINDIIYAVYSGWKNMNEFRVFNNKQGVVLKVGYMIGFNYTAYFEHESIKKYSYQFFFLRFFVTTYFELFFALSSKLPLFTIVTWIVCSK